MVLSTSRRFCVRGGILLEACDSKQPRQRSRCRRWRLMLGELEVRWKEGRRNSKMARLKSCCPSLRLSLVVVPFPVLFDLFNSGPSLHLSSAALRSNKSSEFHLLMSFSLMQTNQKPTAKRVAKRRMLRKVIQISCKVSKNKGVPPYHKLLHQHQDSHLGVSTSRCLFPFCSTCSFVLVRLDGHGAVIRTDDFNHA